MTLVSGKHRRLTLFECSNDLTSMIDIAKVADLVSCFCSLAIFVYRECRKQEFTPQSCYKSTLLELFLFFNFAKSFISFILEIKHLSMFSRLIFQS